LLCAHSWFFLTETEKSSKWWPSHIDNLLRGVRSKGLDVETSGFVDSAFVEIDTVSLSNIWVVNLSLGSLTLGHSLNWEAAINRLPMHSFEFVHFTVDLNRNVGDVHGVL
jgi:hypothetical protein